MNYEYLDIKDDIDRLRFEVDRSLRAAKIAIEDGEVPWLCVLEKSSMVFSGWPCNERWEKFIDSEPKGQKLVKRYDKALEKVKSGSSDSLWWPEYLQGLHKACKKLLPWLQSKSEEFHKKAYETLETGKGPSVDSVIEILTEISRHPLSDRSDIDMTLASLAVALEKGFCVKQYVSPKQYRAGAKVLWGGYYYRVAGISNRFTCGGDFVQNIVVDEESIKESYSDEELLEAKDACSFYPPYLEKGVLCKIHGAALLEITEEEKKDEKGGDSKQ
jgi:hypothetical protein